MNNFLKLKRHNLMLLMIALLSFSGEKVAACDLQKAIQRYDEATQRCVDWPHFHGYHHAKFACIECVNALIGYCRGTMSDEQYNTEMAKCNFPKKQR